MNNKNDEYGLINNDNFSEDKVLQIAKENFNTPGAIRIILNEWKIWDLQNIIKENPIYMSKIVWLSSQKIWNLFVIWNNIKKEWLWDKEYIISKDSEGYITWVLNLDWKVSSFGKIAIEEKAKVIKYRNNWIFVLSEKDPYTKKVYVLKDWMLGDLKEFNEILKWDKNKLYQFESLFYIIDTLPSDTKTRELLKRRIKITPDNLSWKHYYYNINLNKWYFADSQMVDFLKKWILALSIRTDKRTEKYIDLETWEEIDKPKEEVKIKSIVDNTKEEIKENNKAIAEIKKENKLSYWKKIIQRLKKI